MGKASGTPRLTSPMAAQRAYHQYQEEMLRQQAAQAYMNPYLQPRPRDLYIAGQVFDGVTGALKRE